VHVIRITKALGRDRMALIAMGHELERVPAVIAYIEGMPSYDEHLGPNAVRAAQRRVVKTIE
jgi:hypothetical protein